MNACLAAGVTTDHEALGEDALIRLRSGCHTMLREGSAARGLVAGLKAILDNGLDTFNCSIVTDDLHTCDAVTMGHLDASVLMPERIVHTDIERITETRKCR